MNSKILIISVFISNIAFGAVITIPTNFANATVKTTNTLLQKSVKALCDNGLEESVAHAKVRATFGENLHSSEQMMHNTLHIISELDEKDIIAFIAQNSLRAKATDLASYDTIVALLQHKSYKLLTPSVLQKAHKLSQENTKIKNARMIS